jgi:hypothetical protein
MSFAIQRRFNFHTDQTITGNFISPVTNETMLLTFATRHMALTIFDMWIADKLEPEGDRFGYRFSREEISRRGGIAISTKLYSQAYKALVQAGVFEPLPEEELLHELGNKKLYRLGILLRCESNGCYNPTHYPRDYPLPKVMTPLPKDMGAVSQGNETGDNSSRLKSLKEDLRVDKTLSVDSESFETLAAEIDDPDLLGESQEPDSETLENLPALYQEWAWARAKRRGHSSPSRMDITEAWRCYELTGEDLKPGGLWLDGRQNPLTGSKHN